jgi:transcriptional regulator with XRE-family HTH domain
MKNNLKQLRKINGLSQKSLAEIIGVSKAMISMWENNDNEKIPENRVQQICDFFNIEQHLLFDVELDIDVLEKRAMEEEIRRLEGRYRKRYQEFSHKVEQVQLQNTLLREEIDQIINEPEKLNQVKRFVQIINSMENEVELERIELFAKDTLLDGFLSLMENQNLYKIKMLFVFFEYLMLLEDSTHDLNKVKSSFSKYNDEIFMIDEVMSKLGFKGGSNSETR